jgi:hypothetical protein
MVVAQTRHWSVRRSQERPVAQQRRYKLLNNRTYAGEVAH